MMKWNINTFEYSFHIIPIFNHIKITLTIINCENFYFNEKRILPARDEEMYLDLLGSGRYHDNYLLS